jgi:hypothetical protein
MDWQEVLKTIESGYFPTIATYLQSRKEEIEKELYDLAIKGHSVICEYGLSKLIDNHDLFLDLEIKEEPRNFNEIDADLRTIKKEIKSRKTQLEIIDKAIDYFSNNK